VASLVWPKKEKKRQGHGSSDYPHGKPKKHSTSPFLGTLKPLQERRKKGKKVLSKDSTADKKRRTNRSPGEEATVEGNYGTAVTSPIRGGWGKDKQK